MQSEETMRTRSWSDSTLERTLTWDIRRGMTRDMGCQVYSASYHPQLLVSTLHFTWQWRLDTKILWEFSVKEKWRKAKLNFLNGKIEIPLIYPSKQVQCTKVYFWFANALAMQFYFILWETMLAKLLMTHLTHPLKFYQSSLASPNFLFAERVIKL